MMQFDAAVGQTRDYGIVRHHDDGASLLMQFAKQAQNNFFVRRVEVAGRFVGEHDFRIVDEGTRDAHALLLASGELRGQVFGAVFEADAIERF